MADELVAQGVYNCLTFEAIEKLAEDKAIRLETTEVGWAAIASSGIGASVGFASASGSISGRFDETGSPFNVEVMGGLTLDLSLLGFDLSTTVTTDGDSVTFSGPGVDLNYQRDQLQTDFVQDTFNRLGPVADDPNVQSLVQSTASDIESVLGTIEMQEIAFLNDVKEFVEENGLKTSTTVPGGPPSCISLNDIPDPSDLQNSLGYELLLEDIEFNGGAGAVRPVGALPSDQDIGLAGFVNAFGSQFDDLISGTRNDNDLFGGSGNDTIQGGMGHDDIYGDGNNPADVLINPGNDILIGGTGADKLYGGDGYDILDGGAGADILVYTSGADTLIGGGGNDYYDFTNSTSYGARVVLGENFGHDVLSPENNNISTLVFETASSDDVSLIWDYTVEEDPNGSGSDLYYSGPAAIRVNSTGDTIYIGNLEGVTTRLGIDVINEPYYLQFTDGTPFRWSDVFGGPSTITPQALDPAILTALQDHETERLTPDDGLGGDNEFVGTNLADVFGSSGDGNDIVTAKNGNDIIDGTGAGNDTYLGGGGIDTLTFASLATGVTVNLAAGTATGVGIGLNALVSIESVIGGDGDDTLTGSNAANSLNGGSGNDVVNGGAGRDTILGDGGDDTLSGNAGLDTIFGSRGDDEIYGNGGGDTLYGEQNNDILFGQNGQDTLYGGGSADELNGGNGRDILIGGRGRDELKGGSNPDTFVFDSGDGADTILDFESGLDAIDLTATGLGFGDLTITDNGQGDAVVSYGGGDEITVLNLAGQLDATDFVFAASAQEQVSDQPSNAQRPAALLSDFFAIQLGTPPLDDDPMLEPLIANDDFAREIHQGEAPRPSDLGSSQDDIFLV